MPATRHCWRRTRTVCEMSTRLPAVAVQKLPRVDRATVWNHRLTDRHLTRFASGGNRRAGGVSGPGKNASSACNLLCDYRLRWIRGKHNRDVAFERDMPAALLQHRHNRKCFRQPDALG